MSITNCSFKQNNMTYKKLDLFPSSGDRMGGGSVLVLTEIAFLNHRVNLRAQQPSNPAWYTLYHRQ